MTEKRALLALCRAFPGTVERRATALERAWIASGGRFDLAAVLRAGVL